MKWGGWRDNKESLTAMYSNPNLTTVEIARHFGTSVQALYVITNRLGISRPKVVHIMNGRRNAHALIDYYNNNGRPFSKVRQICKRCKRTFYTWPYKLQEGKAIFCSLLCYNKARYNPNRSEAKRQRESLAYKQWRDRVFQRDNYTCQKCGIRDYIEAHHIFGFKENELLRLEVENGVTLCRKCHFDTHGLRLKDSKKVPKYRLYDNPLIECACGCGIKFKKYKHGITRRFVHGHNIRHKKPKESILQIA